MPLKVRLLLWWIRLTEKTPMYELPAVTARRISKETLEGAKKLIEYAPIELFAVKNQMVKARDGYDIPIRIYQPIDADNLPIIVFYHGGGFVIRDLDSHDNGCRRLAHDNQAVVVSVDYRLAPEFKFPIPHQDCYDATVWVSENAASINGDASRLVVMGDSAGGNLATVVAQIARDKKGPKICYQVLIYPTTDARMNHPSIDKFAEGYLLTKPMMQWFLNHYKKNEEDIYNPLMSPLLCLDLSNMPPAFIITAEFDPLKDEGIAYAHRLKQAGVEVRHTDYKGLVHAFFNMPKLHKSCLRAYEEIKEVLSTSIG
ncbi:MAG: alpha/beta hydrolase [Chitinophagales bacterium]